ncbi:MAG TPA: hypothetical protein VM282_01895 [Acidimicrobiales bacterium]|nr:hypothetical protein [Acidimicrobiales bacterium]
MHDWLTASGHASPFAGALAAADASADPTTTRVEVGAQLTTATRAVVASQPDRTG